MKKEQLKKILLLFVAILTMGQIINGFLWMFVNLTNIPIFGDSMEYYQLSQTLKIDEYRTILYPVLIRFATKLGDYFSVPYQLLLYILQTVLSFSGILYFVVQCGGILWPEKKRGKRKIFLVGCIWISLYLLTIPIITFMNFSVLTDSIATSMILFTIGSLVHIFHSKKLFVKDFVVIFFSMFFEYIVRADRVYSCTFFLIVCFIVYLIKKRKEKVFRHVVAFSLTTILLSATLASGVNRMTQQPGLYGRISTTVGFVLLDRVVWPHMQENYSSFPQEIQEIISEEDAKIFDEHNNNVMYQMAPLLREKVGEEQAEKIYWKMARIVFANQPLVVIGNIVEDILCVFITPISAFFNIFHLVETADDWNLYCVSQNSPILSGFYYYYYLFTFMTMLVVACIHSLRLYISRIHIPVSEREKMAETVGVTKVLGPGFLLCLIIACWFSIGDGAPPNDRYAMIHYVIWTFWVLGILLTNKEVNHDQSERA